ncbi:MAG: ATP-binding protein [Gammaproteobacteria bacterium]
MHIFQKLTVLSLLCFMPFSYANAHFEILVLHSYSQEYPWTKNQHNAFIAELNSAGLDDSTINTEYLDSKRKTFDAEYISSFHRYLLAKYNNYSPNIIYVTDDNALTFALEHFKTLFPHSPIVFSGVNNYSIKDSLDRTRITGVFEKKDISINLQLIRHIDPSTKDILVVGDNSNTYQVIEQEIKQQLSKLPDTNATFIARHSIDDLIGAIRNHSSKYLFLTTLGGITDSDGHILPLNKTISALTKAGDYIILSMEDTYVRQGILGGFVTSASQQGKAAAGLVMDYYSGTEFEHLALITTSPNQYLFNFPVLESSALSLPEYILGQASVINKPLSFYERYRPNILGLIIGLTIVLIVSLFVFLVLLTRKNKQIQSNSIQTQELEQIIFERTMQLSDEKRKLLQAQQIAHIGNYVWEVKSNKTTWSDELYNIVGHTSSNFSPSYETYVDCIHPDDRDQFIQLTQKILRDKDKYTSEYRIVRPNDDIRYVYEQGEVKTDGEGHLTGMVGVIHDITERKTSEDEFQRLQRELNQSRKMEALGQLTGGIAHDFNNMLAIITGYTDLILDSASKTLDPKLLNYLNNISQAASRAGDLVSKMMVFSRNDKGISEPLSFAPLLEESIKMLRSVIPSSIDIKYEFNSKLPDIMMDPIQLHQIMMNLSINAKDAMNGSGDLRINLDWKHQVNNECNACHKHVKGDWIDLQVSDNGCGMTVDVMERIFEPFFTTKKVGQGTGMGMSVLNAIVESHGGHILIDTKIGSGTVFHLLFPPAPIPEDSEEMDFTETVHLEHSGKGQKILIVDDEPALTGYLTEMLNRHGYQCTACNDSPGALSQIKNNPQAYDLVITDQTMPQLLGTYMIRQIWKINPNIPVILTTGYSDTINREQAETLGIHYLDKPIINSQLLALIAELFKQTN